MEWLPIHKVAKELDIPEPTLRRYLRDYEEFIKIKLQGHMQVVHFDSLEVIKKIRNMHVVNRWSSKEVKESLAKEQPMAIIVAEDQGIPITAGEFLEELLRINKRLLQENREMRREIQELRELVEGNHVDHSKLLRSSNDQINNIYREVSQLSRKKRHRGLFKRIKDAIKNEE
ncbi:hypothetical protein [Thermoactinomyces sp. CICC 10521]|uniref:hypothetical protein n=1 Tax=Thermoactinomyces sp. CICC 10521 TaxID=2767426 RepID=UPI0018DB2A4D|nr:hypothetical protein [Thermoactinomyces sp. CICC 10521]MBH8609373.1 hypothetical protein [Thermoactinomyces sp. CICC 10521]